MRLQERRFKASRRRETRADFVARLQRTAMSLPRKFINKSLENMRERCQRLYKARGRLFEEGGKAIAP